MKQLMIVKTCLIMGVLLLLSSSCKKKDEVEPLKLSVAPDYLVMEVDGGSTLPLTINASGPKALTRFKIEAQDNHNIKTTLLDSSLSWGSKFSLTRNYVIPSRNENYTMVLFFSVLDADGNAASISRTLNVKATFTAPTENTGLKLATKNSGNADAFDLLAISPLYSTGDVALQDIVDVPNTTDVNLVSKSWTSASGAKFVAFNAFDYANATRETIKSTFTSGTALSQVNNLVAGSIVIVETNRGGTKRYYAIQITSINEDSPGSNDFYLFNVKH